MKIALIGFMATGKTTVGQILAEKKGLLFIETDRLIEEEEQRSIADIFENEGEQYFRRLEKKVLREVLLTGKDFVLSTGGGIILDSENRQLLKKKTFPILLEASPSEIYRRTREQGHRPLLDTKDPEQEIKKLLKKRQDYYHDFKNRVLTDGKKPLQIAAEIEEMIVCG